MGDRQEPGSRQGVGIVLDPQTGCGVQFQRADRRDQTPPVLGAVVHPEEACLLWVDLYPIRVGSRNIQLGLPPFHHRDGGFLAALAGTEGHPPNLGIRLAFAQQPVIDKPLLSYRYPCLAVAPVPTTGLGSGHWRTCGPIGTGSGPSGRSLLPRSSPACGSLRRPCCS